MTISVFLFLVCLTARCFYFYLNGWYCSVLWNLLLSLSILNFGVLSGLRPCTTCYSILSCEVIICNRNFRGYHYHLSAEKKKQTILAFSGHSFLLWAARQIQLPTRLVIWIYHRDLKLCTKEIVPLSTLFLRQYFGGSQLGLLLYYPHQKYMLTPSPISWIYIFLSFKLLLLLYFCHSLSFIQTLDTCQLNTY